MFLQRRVSCHIESSPNQQLGADFWKFWFGQTISNLGSSVTLFVLPLMVFKLTGSALEPGDRHRNHIPALSRCLAW